MIEDLETEAKNFAFAITFVKDSAEKKEDAGIAEVYYVLLEPVKLVTRALDNLKETKKLFLEAELVLLEPNISLPEQNWDFITNIELRNIIARDYKELANLLTINANKSIIVMCGSIIEALLVSVLTDRDATAKQTFQNLYNASPRKIETWNLHQLISVSNQLNFLDDDTKRQADILRDYRNLIHPTVEIRQSTNLDDELITVEIALLKRVLKALSLHKSNEEDN